MSPFVRKQLRQRKRSQLSIPRALKVSKPNHPRDRHLTNPIKAQEAITAVLFLADPPTMKPMNSSTFPKMMNHRRPNRSELAPHTLQKSTRIQRETSTTHIKAMVTVMVYIGTYHAAWDASPSCVATPAWQALREGTIQKEMPYERARIWEVRVGECQVATDAVLPMLRSTS